MSRFIYFGLTASALVNHQGDLRSTRHDQSHNPHNEMNHSRNVTSDDVLNDEQHMKSEHDDDGAELLKNSIVDEDENESNDEGNDEGESGIDYEGENEGNDEDKNGNHDGKKLVRDGGEPEPRADAGFSETYDSKVLEGSSAGEVDVPNSASEFTSSHGPFPSMNLLEEYDKGCDANVSGIVHERTKDWIPSSTIPVTLHVKKGELIIATPVDDSDTDSVNEPSPPLHKWILNNSIDPPQQLENTCFLLDHSLSLENLILCAPSIRLRDFWMVIIEQMIICQEEQGDSVLHLEPESSNLTEKDILQTELEDEELEDPPKKLTMEIGPDKDGALPKLYINDIPIKFEANIAELEHEDALNPEAPHRSSSQRKPVDLQNDEDEVNIVREVEPLLAEATAESAIRNKVRSSEIRDHSSRYGYNQYWQQDISK